MLVCVDVTYREHDSVAAGLSFSDWSDASSQREVVLHLPPAEPYQPGAFFRRELPCLLAVLRSLAEPVSTIIIDGYVWLDAEQRPGLGALLFSELGGTAAVVGVAKSAFAGAAFATTVRRGTSQAPLFVTAIGMPTAEAADGVRRMHGPHRLPTLLKRVDGLCRAG